MVSVARPFSLPRRPGQAETVAGTLRPASPTPMQWRKHALASSTTWGGSSIADLALQPDGKIIAVGGAFPGGDFAFALARYLNGASGPTDVDAPTTVASGGAYTFGTWTNAASVNVSLAATDEAGGSGVKNITYSATGAQTIASTVQPGASAGVSITAQGVTTVSFYATDNAGNIEMEQSVSIKIDRTAPAASCSASPNTLWPPNHKMINISVSVTVVDALSGGGGFKLVSVTSNEPDNGLGDGDTAGDIADWTPGTNDTTGQLRAERSGTGNGRVYTLQYEARDDAGNTATTQCMVSVPHNR